MTLIYQHFASLLVWVSSPIMETCSYETIGLSGHLKLMTCEGGLHWQLQNEMKQA